MDEETRTNDLTQLGRYVRSGGIFNAPDWYVQIIACRVLGIPPWQVDLNDPVQCEWLERAKIVLEAEEDARLYFEKRQADRYRAPTAKELVPEIREEMAKAARRYGGAARLFQ